MGILQPRILEWVAIPFSKGSSPPRPLNPGLPHHRQILYHLGHQGRNVMHHRMHIEGRSETSIKQTCGTHQSVSSIPQLCQTLCNSMDYSPPDCSVHGNSPGKNTGVGCHALLQGIFATQGLNPGLPPLYCLSHQGSPWLVRHNF